MNNFLCIASWNTSVFGGAFRLMTDDGLRITAEVGIERIAGAPGQVCGLWLTGLTPSPSPKEKGMPFARAEEFQKRLPFFLRVKI